MPKKIKFIKDCDVGKISEIKNYSNNSADSLVEEGYAEYINEESIPKTIIDGLKEEALKKKEIKETAEEESLREAGINLDTPEKRKDYQEQVKRFEKYERETEGLTSDEILKRYEKKVQEEKEEIIRLKKEREKFDTKESIPLPKLGKLNSTFIKEFSKIIKGENSLFFRPDSREIIEIGKIKNKDDEEKYTGFITVKPNRFITIAEKYFNPGLYIEDKKTGIVEFEYKSISNSLANVMLESYILQDSLPLIERIFTVPIPIIYEGKLTFPKIGYDERFNSWTLQSAPEISNPEMKLTQAKNIIEKILSEFCFQTKQDYVNAIAGLLTPFLRGLFSNFNVRTPVTIYEANRERAGKDYLAGLSGILYEGHAMEESPISNNEIRSGGSNEELRKKIMSAMMAGRKRLHFSNNKGHLNNAVFESVTTSTKHSDRILGKNQIFTFDNEIDFSLSGNLGMTMTPDLANRSIFVKLFLDIEDANSRKFQNPNLHKWVLDNRNIVLSALYCLVRNWIKNKCPKGDIPFASYPEWAEVCGGIMECAKLGNPCVRNEVMMGVAVDSETADMKTLFELCYEEKPNQWLKKTDIKRIIRASDENLFAYIDWDKMSGQVTFAKKFERYVGRILSGIKLMVLDNTVRGSRREYKFVKEKVEITNGFKGGKVGKVGKILTPVGSNFKDNIYIEDKGVNLPNPTNPTQISEENPENYEKLYKKVVID